MGIITKINAGGTDHLIASSAYGTCTTAANTAAKVVTLSNFDTLTAGVTIHVRFTNSNTAASPTLNVNSKGAKNIYAYGTTAPGTTVGTSWQAGAVVSFTYNTDNNSSGCWVMNNYIADTNTTYTIPTITLNGSSTTSPSFYAPTGAGTSGQYLKSNGSGAPSWTNFPTIPDVSGKIDTAGSGLSKSGTTLNHSNSVTAQTTQAVYPIKIDAQGHISAYGTAVTIPSAYTLPIAADGTRGGVQIGYSESGTNYAVKLSSEKMYVSVPWTDTKVTTAESVSGTTYYPILATGTGTATRQIDSKYGGLKYKSTAGTSSTIGTAMLYLGNATASGTVNNEQGVIRMYGTTANYIDIQVADGSPSSSKKITLPDKTGTVALTSDIPTVPSNIVNTITTSAGAHSTKSSATGAVSFNVPTKTSHLTNDSGFITSDTKVSISNTEPTTGTWYFPTWHTASSGTGVTLNANDGIQYYSLQGTAGALGQAYLKLGNGVASGTAGNKFGGIQIYSTNSGYATLRMSSATTGYTIYLPAKDGTLAITDNIPTSTSDLTNDSYFVDYTYLVTYTGSSYITMTSGVTLNELKIYVYGHRMAQLFISVTFSSSQTANTSYDIGTLTTNVRPINLSGLNSTYGAGQITAAGVLSFRPQMALNSGSTRYFAATYMLNTTTG